MSTIFVLLGIIFLVFYLIISRQYQKELTTPLVPPPHLGKQLVWSLGLGLFAAIFLWGFWDKDVYALGINAFVFLLLVLILFIKVAPEKSLLKKENLIWLVPSALMALSFLLYENPFLKNINLLVWPGSFAIFYNYSWLTERKQKIWDRQLLRALLNQIFSFFGQVKRAFKFFLNCIPAKQGRKGTIKRILLGITLFLVIALLIIVPLLSSADQAFADKFSDLYNWLEDIMSASLVWRIIFAIFNAVFWLSLLLAWLKPFAYQTETRNKRVDSIIAGIVLGGTLALYLLFLWVQIEQLVVQSLPTEFRATETLVKEGFWELLVLSVINIGIFLFCYGKTNKLVQKILAAFTLASLLLLLSAGQRMLLYVTFYGFSYEKFFAAYTVLYCFILFIYLISRFFYPHKSDIIKFLLLLCLWMYSLVTIFPVEQFVLQANLTLSQKPETRIHLYELQMLSTDVLPTIIALNDKGLLSEPLDHEMPRSWDSWIEEQKKIVNKKAWYETNLMNVWYLISDPGRTLIQSQDAKSQF